MEQDWGNFAVVALRALADHGADACPAGAADGAGAGGLGYLPGSVLVRNVTFGGGAGRHD
ncbi:hypothetical protein EAS64_15805 [Trebonia kvetii]|uniref:Uncharacterized protein n=1 Tax=Trebonia kvetii TaxID=2480626 RepID=A0A6P2C321_9ACTN|nr:hypothetical protein [Trebonia kvetii]TVZ03903.1 hypothetical protein EAS64_15805 [Trebonia kvetii]